MRVSTRVAPQWWAFVFIVAWSATVCAQSPVPRRLPPVESEPVTAQITPPSDSVSKEVAPVSWDARAAGWESTIDTSFTIDAPANSVPAVIPETSDSGLMLVDSQGAEPVLSAPFDISEVLRRLERQEAELQAIRRQLMQKDAAGTSAPSGPLSDPNLFDSASLKTEDGKSTAEKKLDDGWTDVSNEKWTVKLGGHVQMDYPLWMEHSSAIPAENYFEFRRLRLMVDGTGYGVYDFRLQVDYEPEAGDNVATPVVDVKDAYLTAHEVPIIQRWRIGNFFIPFGLEQVTNDTNNNFLERSIPTQNIFCGDREVGFATYGVSEELDTTWTFGTFFDRISESRKERIDDRQGIRVSSRFTHLLYYDEPSKGRYLIHTGTGLFYTHFYDKLTRFRARPQIHEGPFLIDSGDIGAVDDLTANLELATVWGPFSVQSELYGCHINLAGGEKAQLYGYYVHGSYFLTGENRIYERYGQHGAQFGRNVPFSNFFTVPGCRGPGAWELKVRNSNLDLGQLGDGQYQDITAGLNWYWSDRTRVMLEWIHPWTTAQTVFGTTQSNIFAMRMDFNW